MAESLSWPKEFWCLILQSKLRGKASRAYGSLGVEEKSDYEKVKETIRLAYQLTSEEYRHRFREMKKGSGETYCDFVAKSAMAFDLWQKSENVDGDFDRLRQLILMEDFKTKLPVSIRLHLEDQGVSQLRTAAELSDKYALVHRSQNGPNRESGVRSSKDHFRRGQVGNSWNKSWSGASEAAS